MTGCARGYGRGISKKLVNGTSATPGTTCHTPKPHCQTTTTQHVVTTNVVTTNVVTDVINQPNERSLTALCNVSRARGRSRGVTSQQVNSAVTHNSLPQQRLISESKANDGDRFCSDNNGWSNSNPKTWTVREEESPTTSPVNKSGFSPTNNPKNRILGRAKFGPPAMRSLNKAMETAGTPHSKSNRPCGGVRCFSFKEPEVGQQESGPIQIAVQRLGNGKHILEEGYDGQVDYILDFYLKSKADKLLHMLLGSLNFEAPSKRRRGGEVIKQPRLSVWFGPAHLPYSYSYVTLQALEFSSNSIMAQIKADVEERMGCTFNSCLVNLYRDNRDGVGWHADDEPSLRHKPTIASLSLGETRRFEFCKKDDQSRRAVYGFHLEHGSCLLMKGDVQERWLHSVPKEYHDRKPRLNLTFRTIFPTD